jgi:hypothetical protein
LLFNVACSLFALAIGWYNAGYIGGGNFFIAKLLGFAGSVILYQYSAKDSYYYFRNAGCRMRWVITISFAVDILLFIVTFFFINLITHAANPQG